MKQILLASFFILCGISARSQTTVQLKHDSVSVTVGSFQHPINSLRARFNTDSTMTVYGTDNTIFVPERKYNAYTDDAGTPFSSMSTLKAWVKNYFFVNASFSANGMGGAGWDGGFGMFTANGIKTVFDIPHIDSFDNGNGADTRRYWPKFFTITASTSITQNQLDRVISFPSPRIMRITFTNAPLTGDDILYVWSLYKPL